MRIFSSTARSAPPLQRSSPFPTRPPPPISVPTRPTLEPFSFHLWSRSSLSFSRYSSFFFGGPPRLFFAPFSACSLPPFSLLLDLHGFLSSYPPPPPPPRDFASLFLLFLSPHVLSTRPYNCRSPRRITSGIDVVRSSEFHCERGLVLPSLSPLRPASRSRRILLSWPAISNRATAAQVAAGCLELSLFLGTREFEDRFLSRIRR